MKSSLIMLLSFFMGMFFFSSAHSQITGLVFDQKERFPIAGANIYLAKAKTGTTTDDDGFFKLKINANAYKPKFNMISG